MDEDDGINSVRKNAYRWRLISVLDIPTYDNFSKIMFYDVLLQLCKQIVNLYHNKEKIAENKAALKIVKLLKGNPNAYDDTLAALNSENLRQDYQVEFDDLITQMAFSNPRIKLIKDLKKQTTKLHKLYNSRVDTTESFMNTLFTSSNKLDRKAIKVYTTKHWISGQMIQEAWRQHKQ